MLCINECMPISMQQCTKYQNNNFAGVSFTILNQYKGEHRGKSGHICIFNGYHTVKTMSPASCNTPHASINLQSSNLVSIYESLSTISTACSIIRHAEQSVSTADVCFYVFLPQTCVDCVFSRVTYFK